MLNDYKMEVQSLFMKFYEEKVDMRAPDLCLLAEHIKLAKREQVKDVLKSTHNDFMGRLVCIKDKKSGQKV